MAVVVKDSSLLFKLCKVGSSHPMCAFLSLRSTSRALATCRIVEVYSVRNVISFLLNLSQITKINHTAKNQVYRLSHTHYDNDRITRTLSITSICDV